MAQLKLEHIRMYIEAITERDYETAIMGMREYFGISEKTATRHLTQLKFKSLFMKRTIKAISLWEPWASLVATGAKRVETRGWYTNHRGPLLICAAKNKDREAMRLLNTVDFQKGLIPLVFSNINVSPYNKPIKDYHLNFGKAVAVVLMEHCITSDLFKQETTDEEFRSQEPYGDYGPGRYAWIFLKIQRIKNPFEVKGKQGFFSVELPEDVEFIENSEVVK